MCANAGVTTIGMVMVPQWNANNVLYIQTPGKSSVGPAENVCQCRANYYRHGHGIAMECKPCPKNSRTNGARATSSMQCLCDVGRVRENDVCVECKEGTFMTTGASDIRVCKTCPPGTFQNIKGQKKCLPCPVDTYSEAEGLVTSAQCIKCENNIDFSTTNGSTGVANVSGCVCLRGRYMDEKGKCPACPGGGNCNVVGTVSRFHHNHHLGEVQCILPNFKFALSNNTALVDLLSPSVARVTQESCAQRARLGT